ncbi:hypothetical protein B0H16DRAFT_1720456 [Mycena metata]|uniref:Uncharacterized protein n=1 Tax=Mycena metata TaxID=1033252 RepID=A0AAD7NGF0_9AGAR|nr:hypothetical protein B0H16DRAFT_1720456 [Mycena metata]
MDVPPATFVNDQVARLLDQALPPRRDGETDDEFARRAVLSHESKRRAATAFVIPTGEPNAPTGERQPKNARFEDDPGSVSSAPKFRYLHPTDTLSAHGGISFGPAISGFDSAIGAGKPTLDAMEAFTSESDSIIRTIVFRAVGEELSNVPSRVRSPKLDNPSKFSGMNSHTAFIAWLEELTTWMKASFMGGKGCACYRVTILKTYLTGSALQWFSDYVEPRIGQSLIEYEFSSILCAMHQRFITAATAQKATQEFDAVRYKAKHGPLKLADELINSSSCMREPMPEFIIKQRFMKLLPSNISGLMMLHRALSPEYSDMPSLRFHANQIWDVINLIVRNGRTGFTSTSATAAITAPQPNTSISTAPK